jgi:hypothetical protein
MRVRSVDSIDHDFPPFKKEIDLVEHRRNPIADVE